MLFRSATVAGGGEVNTSNDTSTDIATLPQLADLAITLSHTDALYQGRTGVPCTITVLNVAASVPTTGTVTVTDNLPTGMGNLQSISAPSGWSCSGTGTSNLSCNNGGTPVAVGTAYSIHFTVDVNSSAPVPPTKIVNTATVSGGGEVNLTNDTAHDSAVVGLGGPDLTIVVSHLGGFRVGQPGTYYIAVTNAGAASSTGSVLVTVAMPTGLTATAASGLGWSCSTPTTCTRHDPLAAGLSYRIITLTVGVASSAANSSPTTATVSGGADSNLANNSFTDYTAIAH